MMEAVMVVVMWMLGAIQASGKADEKPVSAYVEPQDPERPGIPAADLKLLRETNIFSPTRVIRKTVRPPSAPPGPREKPKPKPPMITGIILDPESQTYQVIVEDRNDAKLKLLKEPVFLKAGQEVLVYQIESISREKVVVKIGAATRELKAGDSFPEADLKAPEGAETSDAEGDPEARADTKSEAKSESKSAESSTTTPPDEEQKKKILEERRKNLGKKRRGDNEN